MTSYEIDQFSSGYGYDSFSGGYEAPTGPYIPEARDCQRCGVCVRNCPTYHVRQEENYGPRGRIRLIERVIVKNETLTPEEITALNACTQCRACETVCPSKMDYAGLYHQAMETIGGSADERRVIALLLAIFAKGQSLHRVLTRLLRLHDFSGIRHLVDRLPTWLVTRDMKQLNGLIPVPYKPVTVPGVSFAPTAPRRGEVALFTGCVGNVLDTPTHGATVTMLNALGYDVRVLEDQVCCGSMYAHNGDMDRAKAFARTNSAVFADSGVDAVLFNASGCGAYLSEYDTLLADESGAPVHTKHPPVVDVLAFLKDCGAMESLSFQALPKRVAVHEPCTQRNVLKSQDAVYELLKSIPDLDVVPLDGNSLCCGAGGTQMLTQPELAAPLRDEKVQALLDSEAEILLSTNLTCALHLARGVREAGRDIQVLHPISLLAQQLG